MQAEGGRMAWSVGVVDRLGVYLCVVGGIVLFVLAVFLKTHSMYVIASI